MGSRSCWERGYRFIRPQAGGHISIEGKQYSALSQSGYIVKGEKVTVIGGEGDTLIVRHNKKGNP